MSEACQFVTSDHGFFCYTHATSESRSFYFAPPHICDIGLAALRATVTTLEQDLAFLGASRTETGELKIDMAKYHASHRCEEHRKSPWRSQDLDQCVPCLRATVEEQARVVGRLREALKFYAAEESWIEDAVDIGVGIQTIPDTSLIDQDGGRMARQALSPTPTEPT
jgi:hypothetical protein